MYIFMKKHTISYTLALVLLSFGSFAQELAKGYVFEDRNGNGEKERREDGIAGVSVTNGVDVVQTDRKGYYELMVGDDNIIEIGRAHAELQSLMRISSAVYCLKNKIKQLTKPITN